MSGPSTPKHSADKRARKLLAGLKELRIYVPAADHERLRRMVRDEIEAGYRAAGNTQSSRAVGDLGFTAQSAVEYFRANAENRRPEFVPSRVRLPASVRGDHPFGRSTIVLAGDYDCDANQWGAVSVKATNGHMLEIKPKQFLALEWRANNKLVGGAQ